MSAGLAGGPAARAAGAAAAERGGGGGARAAAPGVRKRSCVPGRYGTGLRSRFWRSGRGPRRHAGGPCARGSWPQRGPGCSGGGRPPRPSSSPCCGRPWRGCGRPPRAPSGRRRRRRRCRRSSRSQSCRWPPGRIDRGADREAEADLRVVAVEDVRAVPGAGHPGSDDRTRRGQVALAPGDVLPGGPVDAVVDVADGGEAPDQRAAVGADVIEELLGDHPRRERGRGGRETGVLADPGGRGRCARVTRQSVAWPTRAEVAGVGHQVAATAIGERARRPRQREAREGGGKERGAAAAHA